MVIGALAAAMMARSKIMDQSSRSMRNCKQQGRMKWAIWCEAQPPEIDLKRRRILGVSQRRKEVGERDPDRERGEGQGSSRRERTDA